jgi:hypothetical protein
MDPINLIFLEDRIAQKLAASWLNIHTSNPSDIEWAMATAMPLILAEPQMIILKMHNICTNEGLDPLAYSYIHNKLAERIKKTTNKEII